MNGGRGEGRDGGLCWVWGCDCGSLSPGSQPVVPAVNRIRKLVTPEYETQKIISMCRPHCNALPSIVRLGSLVGRAPPTELPWWLSAAFLFLYRHLL